MPPTVPPITAKIRYSVPMSLWLVLNSQRVHEPGLVVVRMRIVAIAAVRIVPIPHARDRRHE